MIRLSVFVSIVLSLCVSCVNQDNSLEACLHKENAAILEAASNSRSISDVEKVREKDKTKCDTYK